MRSFAVVPLSVLVLAVSGCGGTSSPAPVPHPPSITSPAPGSGAAAETPAATSEPNASCGPATKREARDAMEYVESRYMARGGVVGVGITEQRASFAVAVMHLPGTAESVPACVRGVPVVWHIGGVASLH